VFSREVRFVVEGIRVIISCLEDAMKVMAVRPVLLAEGQ